MKTSKRFQSVFWLFALLLGALACGGGGGGGGESFIVSGVWNVSGTGPGTPNPSDPNSLAGRACSAAAAGVGAFPGTQLNVVQQDGTVTANEIGSDFAFAGTVDTGNQSFTLNSTTPVCQSEGACTLCGSFGIDFFNAAGNTADVNMAVGYQGNAACPIQCVVTFPMTSATRS